MPPSATDIIRARRAKEKGPPFEPGPRRVLLLYPSPYRAGMSSLGFQWIHGVLAGQGFAVERAFLPDDPDDRSPLLSYETLSPVGSFPVIGVSLAYELELAGLIRALTLAGIPPLRKDRGPFHPRLILGGPLTFSNPLPAAPYADLILLGEAEEVVGPAMELALDRQDWLSEAAGLPGALVCESLADDAGFSDIPAVAKATDALLPARSRIVTPDAELSDMFLLEGERGCHRSCTFCVMRRSTNGGMRLVDPERLMSLVPDYAPRVGLVGAAISDHPRLVDLLGALIEAGKGVGISSLRADRVALKPDIARLLRQGGYSTLTVASDAASQRLRRTLSKGTTEAHLLRCVELAAEHRYRVLKVYMMLGLPTEGPDDIEELIRFSAELAKIHPVALGIAPFVPKHNTPLWNAGFAGQAAVDAQLRVLQKGLRRHRVEVRATSSRWAWVEAVLAQGTPRTGEAVLSAVQAGGSFADYRRAFGERVPGVVEALGRAA